MTIGSKNKYTDKQKRKAEHIENSYEEKGVSHQRAEQLSWATVNKQSGGGEKSGSGKTTPEWKKQSSRQDSAYNAGHTRHQQSEPYALENQPIERLRAKAREKHISGRSTMSKEVLIIAIRNAR